MSADAGQGSTREARERLRWLVEARKVSRAHRPLEAEVFGEHVGETELEEMAHGGPHDEKMPMSGSCIDLCAVMPEHALIACAASRAQQHRPGCAAAGCSGWREVRLKRPIERHQWLKVSLSGSRPRIRQQRADVWHELLLAKAFPPFVDLRSMSMTSVKMEPPASRSHTLQQPCHPGEASDEIFHRRVAVKGNDSGALAHGRRCVRLGMARNIAPRSRAATRKTSCLKIPPAIRRSLGINASVAGTAAAGLVT